MARKDILSGLLDKLLPRKGTSRSDTAGKLARVVAVFCAKCELLLLISLELALHSFRITQTLLKGPEIVLKRNLTVRKDEGKPPSHKGISVGVHFPHV